MKKVAIIGAPNVGKSTFFNKLIGGRRSIVEDMPGVTRDRIYAEVDLSRFYRDKYSYLPLEIIDTGGLFFDEDSMYDSIQNQVMLALKEADCILFLINAKNGLTSTESTIANLLFKSNKPVIVLANKLDSPEVQYLHTELFQLGFKDVLPFSSLGKTFFESIRDLIDKLIEYNLIPTNATKSKKKELEESEGIPKIALLGKPNTGKSSILNKLVGEERSLVKNEAGTTRDALDTYIKYYGRDMMLIDTAGLRRKTKITGDIERYSVDRSIKAMMRSDISLLVMDATDDISHQEQVLASLIKKRAKGCIIVLNKWDLIPQQDPQTYADLIRARLGFISYAPVVITSAHSGQRINQILEKSLEVHANLHKKIKTNVLNTALREITSLKRINSKLKIYYITQTGTNPVTFTLFVNQVKYLDKNYLVFLERSLREEFGFDGVPFIWNIRKSQ